MKRKSWKTSNARLMTRQHWSLFIPLATVISLLVQSTGWLQGFDLRLLDRFFVIRGEAPRDPHVVLVTIEEEDLSHLQEWPISDQTLSLLINKISAENPAVIGLDLFRNFNVGPGGQALEETWQTTPNLVGIHKIIGQQVPPNPTLDQLGQTAMADIVLDADSHVRRGLLSIHQENGDVVLGLAPALALKYLEQYDIALEAGDRPNHLKLGKATFREIKPNEGAYVGADIGGYQILLNYQGLYKSFNRVSLLDVIQGKTPKSFFNNKVVIIGTTAESVKDRFQTPLNSHNEAVNDYTPGVYIHANLASQMIASALEGRPLLNGVPTALEWLWVLSWSGAGTLLSVVLVSRRKIMAQSLAILVVGGSCGLAFATLGSSYGLFLLGWWMPAVPAAMAASGTVLLTALSQQAKWKYIATHDALTKIANRRHLDDVLDRQETMNQAIAVILCDIDFFKQYNDNYGHPAGDACLQKVAKAMQHSIRDADIVGRYGGEEFMIIITDINAKVAKSVAERIRKAVETLQIPHEKSLASRMVTISGGIAYHRAGESWSSQSIIHRADTALYQAKKQGRNQMVFAAAHESAEVTERSEPGVDQPRAS